MDEITTVRREASQWLRKPRRFFLCFGQTSCIKALGAKHLDMAFTPELLPEIFDNVTIGSGAKAFGKVKLGDHVVVGTNSVVTQSFEAYSIVVGIPARKVAS